jgi:hypothetical protein
MARERRGKQKASSSEIESSPSSHSEATQEASLVAHRIGKRKVVAKAPLRSRGCGRPNPQGTFAHGAHPCMKHTSTRHSYVRCWRVYTVS